MKGHFMCFYNSVIKSNVNEQLAQLKLKEAYEYHDLMNIITLVIGCKKLINIITLSYQYHDLINIMSLSYQYHDLILSIS